MNSNILILENITKRYKEGKIYHTVLDNITFSIKAGELVSLVGPSGSGKTTLLQIAGLLDTADSGLIEIGGSKCIDMKEKERTQMRRKHIGFVYQFHHLLPEFTAIENVSLPLRIMGNTKKYSEELSVSILTKLGLNQRLNHKPDELSGGECQRIAIARSLINNPTLLLADEPTGNLDQRTADKVFGEMFNIAQEFNISALIATHNSNLALKMDRCVELKDGTLIINK